MHRPARVPVPGGTYRLGSDVHYPEERPAKDRAVRGFLMDRTQVTNDAFASFVRATGYVTTAQRRNPAGSMIFTMTSGPVDLRDAAQWWRFMPGADYAHPGGPGTGSGDKGDHPVVHVSQEDACAYADWVGGRLPTEWEWEAAARGGLVGADYVWGDDFSPDGCLAANIWTGVFPWYHADGLPGTVPVGRYQANGFGLFDMAGNVWEIVKDPWETGQDAPMRNGPVSKAHVIKGGSFLCADNYCLRYRPAARQAGDDDLPTNHIGFRTIDHKSADAP